MPPTPVTFTNNKSATIAFSGIIKIKCDDVPAGGYVSLLEERNDGNFESPGLPWATIPYERKSATFELYGNYQLVRSHDSISVGYVSA